MERDSSGILIRFFFPDRHFFSKKKSNTKAPPAFSSTWLDYPMKRLSALKWPDLDVLNPSFHTWFDSKELCRGGFRLLLLLVGNFSCGRDATSFRISFLPLLLPLSRCIFLYVHTYTRCYLGNKLTQSDQRIHRWGKKRRRWGERDQGRKPAEFTKQEKVEKRESFG